MGMYLVGRRGAEMTFSFISQHAEYPFCLDSILCNIHTAVLHPPAGTPIVPTWIYIPRFASVAHSSMGSHDRNVESLAETSHLAPGLCRCVLRGWMGRNMLQIMDIGFERVRQGSRASAERVLAMTNFEEFLSVRVDMKIIVYIQYTKFVARPILSIFHRIMLENIILGSPTEDIHSEFFDAQELSKLKRGISRHTVIKHFRGRSLFGCLIDR